MTWMSSYNGMRSNGSPTHYSPIINSPTVSILTAGLTYAAVILAVSLFILIPGFYGHQMACFALKVTIGLFITSSILVCNFGQEWEIAKVVATTQYRAGIVNEIKADIEVKIGLRSVNITLKGKPTTLKIHNGSITETINYNERFAWDNLAFTPGRPDFGPNAGKLNHDYRDGQLRGLPYPILRIAQYFILDGGDVRWGSFYRSAGYYAHAMSWLAFPMWILSMILLHMVVRTGGYMCCMTGIVLSGANFIFVYIRNPLELVIPINSNSVLTFTWGWSFYLNAVTGCVLLGALVVIMDCMCYVNIARFMGADILSSTEEYHNEQESIIVIRDISPLNRLASVINPHNNAAKSVHSINAEGQTNAFFDPDVYLQFEAIPEESSQNSKQSDKSPTHSVEESDLSGITSNNSDEDSVHSDKTYSDNSYIE